MATQGIATTRDAFFGGKLILTQPARGHRAGTDAVLLAAAVPLSFAGLAYDVGAGVGVAGLGVVVARPAARVELIENEPLAVALAEANILANGLAARATVRACDLFSGEVAGLRGGADLVITNPPFHEAGRVRASPDPRRRAAHIEGEGGLDRWIAACLSLLGARGSLVVIHRSEGLPVLLQALGRQAGALTLMPIFMKRGASAKRIIVRATKGSRAPLTIAPGLVLHEGDRFTPEAERLHRGEAVLAW